MQDDEDDAAEGPSLPPLLDPYYRDAAEPSRSVTGQDVAPRLATSFDAGSASPTHAALASPRHDAPGSGFASPRAELSTLAVTSLVVALLGPLGAVAAIVFGWAARREIEASGRRRRGRALATAGLALGSVLTIVWGGLLGAGVWSWRDRGGVAASVRDVADVPSDEPLDRPRRAEPRPEPIAPKVTEVTHSGAITVVDIGISTTALAEELAKQRAAASSAGETMLVMTTRAVCDPCRGVDAALADPLTQTALAKVRVVRVDVNAFHEDLDALKIPRDRIPGFFLLSLDLAPRDGIDGGEWDDDVAGNIAPVLGAFVRGRYTARREAWRPTPSGTGTRL